MINCKRISIFVFFILLPSTVFSAHEVLEEDVGVVSRCARIVKTASKITAGVGLALGAHILTEYPIVLTHEYGHHFGNYISGGNGGRVELMCMLREHPFGVLLPFFGRWNSPNKSGNELVCHAAGPLAGIAANYSIMVAANTIYKNADEQTQENALKQGMLSPWYAYKNISDEISNMITSGKSYQARSFSDVFMMTFNLLKTTKMFGEFLYGLTPISLDIGDGKKIWRELGLRKDCTVRPLVGLALAIIPTCAAVTHGMVHGAYQKVKSLDE